MKPTVPLSADGAFVSLVLDLLDSGEQISETGVADLLTRASMSVDASLSQRVAVSVARTARWRRRDGELSALISSARELSELRDAQVLLQRLVDRAHDLMHTDLTYLSEYDDRSDELFVRANRGAVSARLTHLRVPAGVGLASKVVRTRTPQWTADYETEEDVRRAREVDEAIQAEHMRSLLGVPMIAGGHLMGVLFAADREVHTFGAEEIALLSAFADHAAIALQTARLFEAVKLSAAEAQAAQQRAQERADLMTRSASIHEEMTRVVLEGRGSSDLANVIGRALGRTVAILDRDYKPVGAFDESEWLRTDGILLNDVRDSLEKSRQTGLCVPIGSRPAFAAAAAVAGKVFLGALLVGPGASALSDVERRTVERGAQTLALLTMQQDAIVNAEERARTDLVADLISGRSPVEEVLRRGKSRGIELDRTWVAVAVPTPKNGRDRALRFLNQTHRGWLAAHHDEGVTVLVPEVDAKAAAQAVRSGLSALDNPLLLAVASGKAGSLGDLPSAVTEAWSCAEFLPHLGVVDAAVAAVDFAPYFTLFGPTAARAEEFIRSTIGGIIQWDDEHNSELVKTLLMFIDQGTSTTATARALFIHPNTVKQRLDRITALIGPWRSAETVFRLSVALRLYSIQAQA
ncbi:GAF domain-containing protein [Pseudarthrobacter sp. SL88]|uniref:helix-turn-helix domain-containing protein n=1 Tax=Pseudarthrobacter sp. SL88 TaxID=2994666 RepID=UPI002276FB47|nr:GAF domain-containing protein [Pseudarthrobacter sp. SL88]MCY1674980.1 GAF domain-containing protein [Pseudarthrobacter sp. SL88]